MSFEKLREHRAIWARKPVLADVYRVWFEALFSTVPHGAQVLELGAGPGFLAEHARRSRPDLRWIASDLIETPWNDLVADGLRLPLRGGCLDAIVALDFVHHIARPAAFFREAARVVKPEGRVSVLEPWVTPFSFPIYRYLHQEDCRLDVDPWSPFVAEESAHKEPFQGDAAVPWRLVRDTPAARWEQLGYEPPQVTALNAFAYLASLGFRRASLSGRRSSALLRRLDGLAAGLAPYFGMRALIRWERRAS